MKQTYNIDIQNNTITYTNKEYNVNVILHFSKTKDNLDPFLNILKNQGKSP